MARAWTSRTKIPDRGDLLEMATRENTDYLRFNAFAIKDLITRKLAQDSNYTDQIYPGSNLAILIDIISYMYQTLMYNLNSAASETMWADTRIYENINRLSQFLGYNPHGMNPSYAFFTFPSIQTQNGESVYIPRYSYLDSGLTDAAGNKIFFSTVTDTELRPNSTENPEIIMYNGKWKLYDTVFVAEGVDWETFVLNGIRSDSSTGNYVANNFVHIYVAEPNGDSYNDPEQYFMTDEGLFKARNEFFAVEQTQSDYKPYPTIYKPEDKIFNLRLDETKTYTVTFGNGRQGRKLKKGSAIYVFYLESNGPLGSFNINQINGKSIFSNVFSYQYTKDGRSFTSVFQKDEKKNYLTFVSNVSNISPMMGFALEESVDEIRDFAPNWFRMGNRLVTKRDYEYYLKNSPQFRGVFKDVKCMNNWDYMSTFYKWLYDLGLKYHEELNEIDKKKDVLLGRRFLTQDRILSSGRRYADPADANNVYLFYLRKNPDDMTLERANQMKRGDTTNMKRNLLPIKDLTHEPEFVFPIQVVFEVSATGEDPKTYIEITVDDEVIYASASLQNTIAGLIRKFFDEDCYGLGTYVDFNSLQNSIFEINGVNKIRTVCEDNGVYTIKNGISFASWSDDKILQSIGRLEKKLDLEVSSAGRSLEPFQYPKLAENGIPEIKIIKKSAAALNTVVY